VTTSNSPQNSSSARTYLVLWVAVGLLAATAIAVAVFKAWPLLHPDVVARAPIDSTCDLRQGACSVRLPDGGEIRLDIVPRGIPVVQPLRVAVELRAVDARGVEVDFSGVDMNMGYNRVSLSQVRPGRYEGKAMLPVCVRDHMRWEANVLVQSSAGYLLGPFRFDTFRH
jgi:hypothetical protein